VMLKLHVD